MIWRLLRSSKSREQKNDAPSSPSAKIRSLTVWAIVDLPVPANPFSQKTGDLSKSSAHNSISLRTLSRVPLRQPRRLPWRYSAPFARRHWFRTESSAVRCVGERRLTIDDGESDLCPGCPSYRQAGFCNNNPRAHHHYTVLIVHCLLLRYLSPCWSFSGSMVILFWSAANLVLENGIPEILRQSRDSQHVYFLFLVSLGIDELVEGFRLVPDRAEVTGRRLTLSSIRVRKMLPTTHAGVLARGYS